MKKLISLLLAAVMLVGMLAACGQTTPPATTASKQTQAPAGTNPADTPPETTASASAAIPPKNGDHYVIGISQPFMGHPVRQAGQILIDAWNAEHPEVEIIVTDGQLDAQKQISDLAVCQRIPVFKKRKQGFFCKYLEKQAKFEKKRRCSNSNSPAFSDSWQHI